MITEEVYILPASFAQQRLWILSQLDQNSFAYNLGSVVRLSGVLNIDALERSLNEIMRRHEILRTTFSAVDGQPMQVIAPTSSLSLTIRDLGDVPESERDAVAMNLTAEESQLPFDLSSGPLLRATLLRLGETEHLLLLFMHHIVSDGWSIGVLFKELSAIYEAFQTGQDSPLDELTIQYADYAQWQRERLSGAVLETQLEYWKEHLRGAPALLELPSDRPRPAVQSYRGSLYRFVLGAELTQSLRQLSQSSGATLYMTLLTAFTALLSRYSGQQEVVVGTPIANRTRAEVEELIGFFVNTLVLRTDFSYEPAFSEALQRVKEVCLASYSHQDIPFEKLVEALEPERSLSYNPLFQVMFVLQNMPAGNLKLPGLNVEVLDRGKGHATVFDLTLSIDERDDKLKCALQYNTDLFDEATISRMAGHYQKLLEAVVTNPDQRVSELPLLTGAEERRLLVEWNDNAAAYPQSVCLHHLFEAQVERTPDAVALIFEEKELTYAELNRRANCVAHYLIARGVGAEDLVGICMARSVELVVGVLGILKAGAAYVPMDPAYPQERLAFMLEDAGGSLLLTHERLSTLLPQGAHEVVCIDTLINSANETNPKIQSSTSQLSHVIYTSGSTGRPKGVAITHRSATAFITWSLASCNETHLRGVLASTSICFDLSVYELFAPLSSGGTVILAENALQLPELVRVNQVTLINTVPSAMAELLRLGAVPSSVRRVNLAGEALGRSLVEEIYATTNVDEVWNLYGPSEDTTYSTAAIQPRDLQRVTIGRPISNTQAYILDQHLRPTPIGVTGELYLGGAGLSRGYFRRPQLTAERFIPDPFATTVEPPATAGDTDLNPRVTSRVMRGGRLYRTGDLARYLPDGNIEFLGRADHQLKLRGFRIELGEIEAVIGEHEQVSEVVVVAREDEQGEKRLVAYLVSTAQLETSELRAFAKQRLPEHMVPSTFVTLDHLPLNANGKVDRGALPEPGLTRQSPDSKYEAARTPIEEILVGLWQEVLGLDRVGVHDNFFELGGHSLLATRLVARARDCLCIELPLRAVFEAPTVAELAAMVSATERGRASGAAIGQLQRPASLQLSFAQERLWLLDQLEPGSPAYNIPVGVRLEGALDVAVLGRSLNEIVRRHEALRTVFVTENGGPVQVVLEELHLDLPVEDLSWMATAERDATVRRLTKEAAHQRFELSTGPLLAARLLRFDDSEHILLFTMHHIVGDGWSVGVILKELSVLYTSFKQGEPSPLPELPLQYADYAIWQRHWLSGAVFEEQLAYWKQQLGKEPLVLELPTDRARPALQSFRGAQYRFALDKELTAELKRLSRKNGATLFMTLLAGFKTLLSRYSRQEEVAVGTPIANRTRAELESLIGFFVNTLVLRTDLDRDLTFSAALQRVKQTCIGAFNHQDMPFEKLVEALEPERSLSRNPLFQVMFAFQSNLVNVSEQSSLSITPADVDGEVAKFELTLYLVESDDQLVGSLEYNTDLFDEETIQRMAGHYVRLLSGAASDPEQRISEIPLLSDAEEKQSLVEWNDTATEFPPHTFVELFEAQIERRAEAIAVVTDEERLSYAELNRRADRLAQAIGDLGVDLAVPIGLLVNRGAEWLTAVLALWKAGGIYLPLDPQHPATRLSQILDQGGIQLVLTTKEFVDRLHATRLPSQVLRIDELLERSNTEAAKAPHQNDLAYVIYTSGSTGIPKGAMIRHEGMLNHLYAKVTDLNLVETDVVAQTASQCFDISVWQLLAPLLVGAQVRIVSDEVAHDPAALLELVEREKITILETVPSLLAGMPGDSANELSLKWLLVTGEALSPELPRRWLASHPNVPLLNAYGPTECSDDVTHHAIRVAPEADVVRMPIGRPVANTRLYVLDQKLKPVPIGVTGELYVGGKGVGLGYLNDPKRTAQAFIADPFATEPGNRLYRTGDLVRYLPDGNLEFLGRNDHQVKLRGFRIELGEIEVVLNQHTTVHTSAVLIADDRLIAYVVSKDVPADSETLRNYLKERLPDYMAPSAFVMLESLPLTANGKLDRRALPAPDWDTQALDNDFVAPRTEVEETLCAIWRALLGVERVGVHDNFFRLGGHSLLATQLVSRINNSFGVKLPLRTVFETPTIAGLTVSIVQTMLEEESDENIDQWLESLNMEVPTMMTRVLEPEVMDDMEQSIAYAGADFSVPNQRFADQLVQRFPECIHSVLDIGCGSADIPLRLARLVPEIEIMAVDASATMIQLARESVSDSGFEDRITLTEAYLPGLPFRAHSFDTIISNSLLHHLPDPMHFWREVQRLGTEDAIVFVMDLFRPPSPERAMEIVEAAAAGDHPLLKRDFYNSLLAAFTVDEIRQQLDDAGLSHLDVEIVSERHWLVSGPLSAAVSHSAVASFTHV